MARCGGVGRGCTVRGRPPDLSAFRIGLAFDAALVTGAIVIIGAVTVAVVALLLTVMARLPRVVTGAIVGVSLVMTVGSFSTPSVSLVAVVVSLCVAASLIGATVAALLQRRSPGLTIGAKALAFLLLAAAAAYASGLVSILAQHGDLDKRLPMAAACRVDAAESVGSRPWRKGTIHGQNAVLWIGRGHPTAGIRLRRCDPNADCECVRLLQSLQRLDVLGPAYWGFDLDKLPLNARVWYPDAPGPFPLALIAHGNHRMNDFSDPTIRTGRIACEPRLHSRLGGPELPQ